MSYSDNFESIKCGNCQGEREGLCEGYFSVYAFSLSCMVLTSENIEDDARALDYAATNKKVAIDAPLIGHLASIGCTLSEAAIEARLQQEAESI